MISKDLRVFLNYRRLRNIKRCNNFPTVIPIDVAQHSYYVSILAMILTDEYNTYVDENGYDLPILKSELVLRKALLHDTDEAITSDIPWSVKHLNSEINEAITSSIETLINKTYDGSQTMELYHELSNDCKVGFEGSIVNIADMLELAVYCWEEFMMGNLMMKPLVLKCLRIIQENEWYSQLRAASGFFDNILNLIEESISDVHLVNLKDEYSKILEI